MSMQGVGFTVEFGPKGDQVECHLVVADQKTLVGIIKKVFIDPDSPLYREWRELMNRIAVALVHEAISLSGGKVVRHTDSGCVATPRLNPEDN
jgi:hypothetical protein